MKRRTFLSTMAAGAAMAAMPARGFAQSRITMKIGTSTLQDSQHQWMIEFQKLAVAKSKGRLNVEIYPASQLGATPRLIEQTQMATMQGVVAPPEFMAGIDQAFGVLSAPSDFKNIEHIARTLSDTKLNDYLLPLAQAKGLKGLGLFISGPTAFCSRKEISTPADFAGAKVRVLAAKLQQAQISALSATPIPMPPSEILPALQQGTLDAVMSCIPVMEGLGYMDGAKYFLETNHGVISSFAAVSQEWFEELPSDIQEIVVQSGKEATMAVKQFSIDDVENSKIDWVKKGGAVVNLTSDERKKFLELLVPAGQKMATEDKAMSKAYDVFSAAIARNA